MPSNLQALLILLVFIAPGFLFSQACRYRWPRYYREPNLFRQTVTAVIASATIHALLLLFLGGIALICKAVLGFSPLLSDLIKAKPLLDYSTGELAPIVMVPAGYVLFSLGVSWRGGLAFQRVLISEVPGWFSRLVRTLFGLGKQEAPLWWVLIGREAAAGRRDIRLRVHLRNGDECTGNMEHLRWVGEEDVIFELVLKDVSYARVVERDTSALGVRRLPGHRLLLLSGDILWLSRIDVPLRERPA